MILFRAPLGHALPGANFETKPQFMRSEILFYTLTARRGGNQYMAAWPAAARMQRV